MLLDPPPSGYSIPGSHRPEAEVVERRQDPVLATKRCQRLPQRSRCGRAENDVKRVPAVIAASLAANRRPWRGSVPMMRNIHHQHRLLG
jgi:hypothetical protein